MDSDPKDYQREPHFEMVNGVVLSVEEGKRLRAAYRDGWLTGWHVGWKAAPLTPFMRERMSWEEVKQLSRAAREERQMSKRLKFWILLKWAWWSPNWLRAVATRKSDRLHAEWDQRFGGRGWYDQR